MVIFKKKKSVRQRGHKSHGWGSKKKHRGAGNRGGRGNAGTGKRGDQHKPSIWKERYFGKIGFKKHGQKQEIKPINISSIDEKFDELISLGIIKKEGNSHTINVSDLGRNKVLGSGRLTKKIVVASEYFSESAIKKIEEAGGKVIELSKVSQSQNADAALLNKQRAKNIG